MEGLSKELEKQSVAALKDAIEYANGGMLPDDAVIKAAEAHNLDGELARRVAEAYNVSKTLGHYKQASSAADKLSPFAIADPDKIVQRMYPSGVATPTEKASSVLVKQSAETRMFEDVAPRKTVEILRQAKPYARDINMLFKQAYAHRDVLRQDISHARVDAVSARIKMVDAIEKLSSYFRKVGHTPFSVAEAHAMHLHGNSAKPLMDIVWELSKAASFHEKRASAAKAADARIPEFELLLNDVSDKTKTYNACLLKMATAEGAFEDYNSQLSKREQLVKEALLKESFDPFGTAKDIGIISALKKPNPRSETAKALGDVLDPDYEARMKNIEIQTQLADMMANDPVIKHHPPEKVINAYNELASLSPRGVSAAMSLRALLRKSLEGGGIDAYEINNILSAENAMKTRDEASKENLTGVLTATDGNKEEH